MSASVSLSIPRSRDPPAPGQFLRQFAADHSRRADDEYVHGRYCSSRREPLQPFSTIYMVPVEDLNPDKRFDDLASPGGNVDHVDIYFNAGHPGVEKPHAHLVLWHVPKADEARVAQ